MPLHDDKTRRGLVFEKQQSPRRRVEKHRLKELVTGLATCVCRLQNVALERAIALRKMTLMKELKYAFRTWQHGE